jgi:DNA polymerase V
MPAANVQGSLFETPDDPSSKARMRALDSINRKFGKGTLVFGSAGLKREWDMRRGYMSKSYSTSWDDLLEIR